MTRPHMVKLEHAIVFGGRTKLAIGCGNEIIALEKVKAYKKVSSP